MNDNAFIFIMNSYEQKVSQKKKGQKNKPKTSPKGPGCGAEATTEQELTPMDPTTPQHVQVYTGSKGGMGRSLSHNAPNLQCTSWDSNSRSLSPDTALLLPAPRGCW